MHTVPTSCLERLTPHDFRFIETVLFGREAQGELQGWLESEEDLLAIIEHDQVFQAVIEMPFPLGISPELYFFVLVRRSMNEAGITELRLADYVAATLAAHALGNPLANSLPSRPEMDFTYQVDFLEAMEGVGSYDRFFLQVHCGNQFLVLTGLFPRFLEQRAVRRGSPALGYYEGVARQAFLSAGEHPLAEEFDLGSLLPQLADCLLETRRILNQIADDYLFLGN